MADPSHTAVVNVYMEAVNVYLERNKKYEDGWREAGWETHRDQMRHKLGRLLRTYEGGEDGLDDAIDLINYTAFFIIQAREGIRHDKSEW